jgi:hypothetical protein
MQMASLKTWRQAEVVNKELTNRGSGKDKNK